MLSVTVAQALLQIIEGNAIMFNEKECAKSSVLLMPSEWRKWERELHRLSSKFAILYICHGAHRNSI